jgi:hypothetical protein
MASATGGKTMELEGALGAFQLPDVLRFLAMGHMTGHLSLVNDLRAVELYIKEGKLVGTASPDRHLKLGQVLVYGGQVGRKDIEETLESQRAGESEQMIGEMLIERKLATSEQIGHALQLQMEEEIWDLLSWSDGSFKFDHGVTSAMERALLTLEIEPLLEEGARRMEQWQTIVRTLGKSKDIFRVRPDLAVMPEFKLNPNTWRVLSLINGHHSVEVLVYLSGLGKFETLCALDKLVALQMIELVENAAEAQADAGDCPVQASSPNATTRGVTTHDRTTNGDGRTDASGKRSLFGFRRRNTEPDLVIMNKNGAPASRGGVGPFLTNVGMACDLINRLAGRLCEESAFGARHDALLATLWQEVGLRFPRADLIGLTAGWLDAEGFDRYVKMAGGARPFLVGCFEDSLAALAAIGQHLVRRARERLGGKAEGLIKGTVQPYLAEGLQVTHAQDFMTRVWTQQWIDEGM